MQRQLRCLKLSAARCLQTAARMRMVEEHVRDEKQEYFPIADSAFKDRSDELLKRIEKAKAAAKQNLSSITH